MDNIKIFISWFLGHFDYRFIFVPIATINIIPMHKGAWCGYTDVFVFGIRIVRVQRTKPWK